MRNSYIESSARSRPFFLYHWRRDPSKRRKVRANLRKNIAVTKTRFFPHSALSRNFVFAGQKLKQILPFLQTSRGVPWVIRHGQWNAFSGYKTKDMGLIVRVRGSYCFEATANSPSALVLCLEICLNHYVALVWLHMLNGACRSKAKGQKGKKRGEEKKGKCHFPLPLSSLSFLSASLQLACRVFSQRRLPGSDTRFRRAGRYVFLGCEQICNERRAFFTTVHGFSSVKVKNGFRCFPALSTEDFSC